MRIREVYHPLFFDDLAFLEKRFGKKKFNETLIQLERAIRHVLRQPYKSAILKYSPLQGYRKKKFFSTARPRKKQRPNMRLIYRYVPEQQTVYFLAVGLRIASRPPNQNDVYQRSKQRDLFFYKEEDDSDL